MSLFSFYRGQVNMIRLALLSLLALLLLLASALPPVQAQPVPLPRAHAHNDYEHARPLLDALDHGFGSVEADVHLVDGALLVAHDRADVQPGRTLQALYLDPLRERVRRNGGGVYATESPSRESPSLILLIDVKTDAEDTYAVLRGVLEQYADILTAFTPEAVEEGPVTAVISGNRARAVMAAEPLRYAAYDGRLDDLEGDPPAPASFIPLVSSNWSAVSRWSGRGDLPARARARLEDAVARAHAQGRKLRFWATPDNPAVWQVLYDAGVDLLNTDDLDGLQAFLLARQDP
jgi:hypothetical protein